MKLFINNFLTDDIIITHHFSQTSFSIDQKELNPGRNDINYLLNLFIFLKYIKKNMVIVN